MAKTITYKVLQGIDYPPNKRAEAGDLVTDLPKEAIAWLTEAGVIERVNGETVIEEIAEPELENIELSEVDSGL